MTAPDLAAQLLDLGTATVSDALDRLGVHGCCLGLRPIDPAFRLAGPARTVRYGSVGQVKGTVGDYVDDYAPGTVAVLDNGGRTDATVWGDILTEYASLRGLGGTVIDGVCRDSALCASIGYPVFARGAFMRTGKDRVQVDALDEPVTIGGARVEPGDLMIGDRDGVLVVPAGIADAVLDAARAVDEAEIRIREAVRAGSDLRSARERQGYHGLQSRA